MFRLFPVIATLAACGHVVEGPNEENYARCLCDAEKLSLLLNLVDESSILTFSLARDGGTLEGTIFLDGEVKIVGETISDDGDDGYAVDELTVREENGREKLAGKVVIDDFPDVGFKGEFAEDHERLFVDVTHIGEIWLNRLPDPVEDTAADTAP